MSDRSADGAGGAGDGGSWPPVRRLADWDASRLRSLADAFETPLYVLDLDRARANYRRLAAAFPDAEIAYAAKANGLVDLLRVLCADGATIECASAGEVYRAREAGIPGDLIRYTAVNPPERDLEYVVDAWREDPTLTITAGAWDTVRRLAELGYGGRLCLRVTPGVGAGHHAAVRTGGDATFGLPADRLVETARDAVDRGLDLVGLHAHVGSGVLDADQRAAHRRFVARVADLVTEVCDATGSLDLVSVGGGFGVPYRSDETPLALDALANATRAALADVDARLSIEPGRYLVADAGVLLTEANTVKETPTTRVVGVDAGMTTLLRPALYDASHAVRPLAPDAPDRETISQTVSGPVCESADLICADRSFPRVERGELLAVGNAGAYGYEMTSTYNARPRPATVVVDGSDARLARRRESLSDLARLEVATGREVVE
ncbi:diaminopimelate decarboxylase [Halovivax asiaticus JCM 14624]|uniref:Diaminopimelate decarboxylase n=1 Tax=Halovivax asiaticus JCM 14624 TaxID=1227490 RepID=M0BP10_9EURY|nr:diaminopimelate decarboxylase [Halovivax asiaticus]ELZ12222.1 diaminopimelate decarboxylase [Halovivax asiaticus JCM 14624]